MSDLKTVVSVPELPANLSESAQSLLAIAGDFIVDSEETREMADNELAGIKRQMKRLDDMRSDMKAPILDAGRKIDGLFNPMIDVCKRAAALLQPKILSYDRELAAARAEMQRKLQIEADAQKKQLEDQAEKLQAAGATEAAAAVKEASTMVSAPQIPIAVSTAARSTVTRVTWSAEVVDLMALVKAVAGGTAPLSALQADMTYLNGRARVDKDNLAIPGVKAVPNESLSAKRAA